jgi:glycosyltransferase involved in cell wall biosynthesis
MKQTKILLINDILKAFGGAEVYISDLDKLLKDNGYITYLYGGDKSLNLYESFFSRWYSFKYYKEVKSILNEFAPNIVHIHNFSRVISPSILKPCVDAKIPIVQTVHDYHLICPKLWMINDKNQQIITHDSFMECLQHHLPNTNFIYSLFKSLKVEYHKKYTKKIINHYICPSRDLANWYIKEHSSKKVSVLPNFINDLQFKFTPINKYNNLLFIGRLSKEKGVIDLINAFALVANELPSLTLTIIGEGPEREYLELRSKELKLTNKVIFKNKVSNNKLATYLKDSTVTVIPSVWIENCPIVALESIGMGRPIIASNSGGLKDLVINDSTGLLFERGNVYDLSLKIKKLITNKKTLDTYSMNQSTMAASLSKDSHLRKLTEIYSNLV